MPERAPLPRQADARAEILDALRKNIGGCREDVGHDKCWEPAEYVLWGKLLPAKALGPRCYEHAKKYVDHYGLSSRSGWALINLVDLTADLSALLDPDRKDT